MGINPWNDSRGLFGGGGGTQAPAKPQPDYAGGAFWNPRGGQTGYQRPANPQYQAPPSGATESQTGGGWGGISNLPLAQAQTQQNTKYNAAQSFMNAGMAGSDANYSQAMYNLQQQLGLSDEQMGWQKQGNQLSHDQNAALLNQQLSNSGRDTDFINRALGLAGGTRDQDMARQGLSDQSIGLQGQDLLTNLYRSRRQLDNQYTAGGGWFTPERGLSQNDLNAGWSNAQGQLNIQSAGNNINRQSIGTQYEQAQLAHDKALAANGDQDAIARLKLQFGDQDLAHANTGVGLSHDQGTLQNQQQQYDLSAGQFDAAQQYQKLLQGMGIG